jgi:hypothetical protein
MRGPLSDRGHGGAAVGYCANYEPDIRQSLTERLDCGNIPIDDEYLFTGIDSEHTSRAIRDTKLYSSLTLL